jgi:hypothetical protein
VLIAAILVYGIIWAGMVGYERYTLYKAEKELTKISKVIEASLGDGTSINKGKFCSYSSEKFSKGLRRCSVSINLQNYKISPSDTDNMILKISNSLKNFGLAGLKENRDLKVDQNSHELRDSFKINTNNTLCSIIYSTKNGLSTYISCTMDTKVQFFSVSK